MKPDIAAVERDARLFAAANIPDEFRDELTPQLVDVVLTAYNTEKPAARAFQRKKGTLSIEMKAQLVRTPHTTLPDKIKLEFYIIHNNSNVMLPYD